MYSPDVQVKSLGIRQKVRISAEKKLGGLKMVNVEPAEHQTQKKNQIGPVTDI